MRQTGENTKSKVAVKGYDEITVNTNETLLSSLAAAGILLEAACGGQGSCGTCKIKVLHGQVVDQGRNPVLPNADGFHLACQMYPVGNLVIENIAQPVFRKETSAW